MKNYEVTVRFVVAAEDKASAEITTAQATVLGLGLPPPGAHVRIDATEALSADMVGVEPMLRQTGIEPEEMEAAS